MRYPQPHRSRFALLSASLFAMQNQTYGIFRMIGIMRGLSYFIPRQGADEVFQRDLNKYLISIGKEPVTLPAGNSLADELYDIWQYQISPVVRNRTTFRQKQGMQFDAIIPSPSLMANGIDYLYKAILENLEELGGATAMAEAISRTTQITFDPSMIPLLVDRENLRVPLIWTVVNTILTEYLTKTRRSPNSDGVLKPVVPKIVIGLSYRLKGKEKTVSLSVLAHFLQVFTSVCEFTLIDGSVTPTNKQKELEMFNKSPNPGILLANIASIAEGVSIHDGAEPIADETKHYVRYVIVIPDAYAVRDVQFKGRCDRFGNRSFPFMLTVYPRVEVIENGEVKLDLESSIINKLMRRSLIFNEISGNYEEVDKNFINDLKEEEYTDQEIRDMVARNRAKLTAKQSLISVNVGTVKKHEELIDTSPIAIKLAGQNIQTDGIPVYTENGEVEIVPAQLTNFFLNHYRQVKGKELFPELRSTDWFQLSTQLLDSLPSTNPYNSAEEPIKGSSRIIMKGYRDDDIDPKHDYGYVPQALVVITKRE